jgi:hypothetical protein
MLISAFFSLPFGQARFECIVAAYLGAYRIEAPFYDHAFVGNFVSCLGIDVQSFAGSLNLPGRAA